MLPNYLFIVVFLILSWCFLIEKRIKANQEKHVNYKKRNNPDDYDDNHLILQKKLAQYC